MSKLTDKQQAKGRPTKYKEEFNEMAYNACLLGATDATLADIFEVHVDTIYEWKNNHPEFSESIKKGKYIADSAIANSLYQRAIGCTITKQVAIKLTTKKPVINKKTGEAGRGMMQTEEIEIVNLDEQVPPDTTAAIFWLKNRQPREWRDKQEVETTVSVVRVGYEGSDDDD